MKRIAQQRHLLHLVFVGKTDAEIANSLMKSSSTISERLKKLRNDGLVTQKTRYPSRHEFTAEGEKQFSEFMAVSQNPNAVRLHNISARAEIVRSPENWNELLGSNGFVAFHPRNWRGFKKRFREAAVCVQAHPLSAYVDRQVPSCFEGEEVATKLLEWHEHGAGTMPQ